MVAAQQQDRRDRLGLCITCQRDLTCSAPAQGGHMRRRCCRCICGLLSLPAQCAQSAHRARRASLCSIRQAILSYGCTPGRLLTTWSAGKAGGFLALSWLDDGPVGELCRRSYQLHAELASTLEGELGFRRVTTAAVSLGGSATGRPADSEQQLLVCGSSHADVQQAGRPAACCRRGWTALCRERR